MQRKIETKGREVGMDAEDIANREFLQGKDLSNQQAVGRPSPPSIDDQREAMEFMQIDCDYYTERPKRAP